MYSSGYYSFLAMKKPVVAFQLFSQEKNGEKNKDLVMYSISNSFTLLFFAL